ncbi:MAG: peptide deformylase [Deltaproteobacteria bacterium]|nr:peptide deformylase [Deltaproteobacteria bacterium]MBI4796618.1 peptide deformylase [Deltaproteobacteria bacterium]
MAKLPIVQLPDPVLRQQAREITEINGELQRLIDDMAETMYAAPGIGLAAPQVGVLKRLIVLDVAHREGAKDLQVILNPCIKAGEGEVVREEGCLSVADFAAEVRRHARVTVTGVDREGKPLEISGEGLLAVVLQHEIDHLNGVLFIDHIGRLKRGLYLRRLKKQLAAKGR